MYDILSVTLENFRSFRGKHTFTFPTEPGLYAITGKNLTMRGDESNGAGKSSLLEAVYWCNYGRTTRGVKAGDVICRGTKSCTVTTKQIIGDERVTITRSQSPNSLRLNGTVMDQTALEKHLRLGPEAYAYAVMTPQFGEAFFDRSPADKLTLFTEVMGLDYWLEKSKNADDLAKKLLAEKGKMEQDAASSAGIIETLKEDLAMLAAKRNTFETEKGGRLKQHKENLKQADKDLSFNRSRGDSIATTLKGLEQRRKKAEIGADPCRGLETKQLAILDTIKRLGALDAKCPTCLQKVDARHLKAEKTRLEKAEQLLLVDLETATAAKRDLQTIEQDIRDFEAEKRALSIKIARAEEAVAQLQAAFDTEQRRVNPYNEMLAAKEAQRVKVKAALAKTHDAIKQIEQDYTAVSYWVPGFKRVRLFIVEQALQQLELEVNNSLGSLGLMDWHVELDVERENKSGGVTKGFTVLVWPPDAELPVNFATYSGGETQRLRLAGNLGLANLIMERAGLRGTIEFLDEPSAHLSEEGLLDLAETLAQRAGDTQKRIFVIEHNLPDYPFAGTFTVTRDKNGSSIGAV